jgi:hypothetical protein
MDSRPDVIRDSKEECKLGDVCCFCLALLFPSTGSDALAAAVVVEAKVGS